MIQFSTNHNSLNNINFTGLYLKHDSVFDTNGIKKIRNLLVEKGKFINQLGEQDKTDVFISSNFDRLEFVHKDYGDINKHCSKTFSIDQFTTQKEEDILPVLKKAINKAHERWRQINLIR